MTAPNADQQAVQIEQGADPTDPSGFNQGWFSRIRARKMLSDNVSKLPFVRSWGTGASAVNVVASPMEQDKLTAVADAVGYRRVAVSNTVIPGVVDVGDMILIMWEYFVLTADTATLTQAVTNAKTFRDWPAGYTGNASFDAP
jgi:hypothetical protein